MRERFLLIDANNLTLRALYGCSPLYDAQGYPTACLMTSIRTICRAADVVRPKRTICFWDGGHSEYRKELLPNYKLRAELEPDDPKHVQIAEWKEQCKNLQEYLPLIGVGQVQIRGCEADDLIFSAMQILHEMNIDVTIATTDQDFMQLLGPHCNLYHLGKNAIYGVDDMVNEYDIHPHQFVDFRAMTGDKSDNIDGVKGIGPKKAADILKRFRTVNNFLFNASQSDFLNTKEAKSHHKALFADAAIVQRNQKMMDLRALPAGEIPQNVLEEQLCTALDLVPNHDEFWQCCKDHQLNMVIQENALWHQVYRE